MSGAPNRPLILLGGGGHARVLLDLLDLLDAEVLGVTTADGKRDVRLPPDVRVLGNDGAVSTYSTGKVSLVNALGFTTASAHRRDLQQKFAALGYAFPALVHPAACVSKHATLRDGCQIMAGAVVQTGAVIGEGAIINTRASIDHDCVIGVCTHIAPGAILCGDVRVGDCSLIGAGATVIQGRSIGSLVTVGAGGVVIHNTPDHARVGGVPARQLSPKIRND